MNALIARLLSCMNASGAGVLPERLPIVMESSPAVASPSTFRRRNAEKFRLRQQQQRGAAVLKFCLTFVITSAVLACNITLNSMLTGDDHAHNARISFSDSPIVDDSGIRYLSFGSQSGGELQYHDGDDHRPVVVSSYPQQLSTSARQIKTARGAPVMAAACTQSIVGDDAMFDVITIEIDVGSLDESHVILAERLRRRFPFATIVLVRLWNPFQLKVVNAATNGSVVEDLPQWKRRNGDLRLHSDAFASLFVRSLEEGNQWLFEQPGAEENERLRAIATNINALIVDMPQPEPEKIISSSESLVSSLLLFREENDDWLLSNRGHEVVAARIRSVVNPLQILFKTRSNRDEKGSWGEGDHCDLWYSEDSSIHRNSAGVDTITKNLHRLTEFGHSSSGHKHALEFGLTSKGSITVTNPFGGERTLFLTYMTVPEEDDYLFNNGQKTYPQTRVRLNGKPSVLIDPIHNNNGNKNDESAHHLTRTSSVGLVAPGDTIVQIEPMQKSELKFRLVGASVLGEESARVPVEFELESEPAMAHQRGLFWQWW